MLTPKELKRRKAAYEQGRTDAESARMLGMTMKGYERWRERSGLPAKNYQGRPKKIIREAEAV